MVEQDIHGWAEEREEIVGHKGGPLVRLQLLGSRSEIGSKALEVDLNLSILAVRVGQNLLPCGARCNVLGQAVVAPREHKVDTGNNDVRADAGDETVRANGSTALLPAAAEVGDGLEKLRPLGPGLRGPGDDIEIGHTVALDDGGERAPVGGESVGVTEGEGHTVWKERFVDALCARRDVALVPLVVDHSVVVSAHRVVEVAFEIQDPPELGREAIGQDCRGEPR